MPAYANATWKVPFTNDGGTPINYQIAYSNSPITVDNWDSATVFKDAMRYTQAAPDATVTQSVKVVGVATGTVYFAIRYLDSYSNLGDLATTNATYTIGA
jgi:hypothetical protein